MIFQINKPSDKHDRSQIKRTFAEVEIGMGATKGSYSDRHPATVIDLDSKYKVITLQQDRAKRTDKNGMDECQEYIFITDPKGELQHYRFDKAGIAREVVFNKKTKRWNKASCGKATIGRRSAYFDYSF